MMINVQIDKNKINKFKTFYDSLDQFWQEYIVILPINIVFFILLRFFTPKFDEPGKVFWCLGFLAGIIPGSSHVVGLFNFIAICIGLIVLIIFGIHCVVF